MTDIYKAQTYRSTHAVKLPGEDTVDLCLSFTSAGMPECDPLPLASENKSCWFRSNSGQLHLLWLFNCNIKVLLLPKRTCLRWT